MYSSRWVVTEKFKNGKQVVKARLVAKGFGEDSADSVKYSPTCTRESLRLLFTVAATMNWKLQSVDITYAILQGNTISRDVYIQLPKDARRKGVLWKLKPSVNRLSDPPRAWYDKVRSEMKRFGATITKFDKTVFMWHENEKLVGLLVCHVDDFLFAGTEIWKHHCNNSVTENEYCVNDLIEQIHYLKEEDKNKTCIIKLLTETNDQHLSSRFYYLSCKNKYNIENLKLKSILDTKSIRKSQSSNRISS